MGRLLDHRPLTGNHGAPGEAAPGRSLGQSARRHLRGVDEAVDTADQPGKLVLVVDDEEAIRNVLSLHLTQAHGLAIFGL